MLYMSVIEVMESAVQESTKTCIFMRRLRLFCEADAVQYIEVLSIQYPKKLVMCE